MTRYYCDQLNSIAAKRVRNIDDAARRFAHRLAEKFFGRTGRCFYCRRIRSGNHWAQFEAEIGRMRGPRSWTSLVVEHR